jgi:dihydrofolate synthase/folylpolyglutamate synthase
VSPSKSHELDSWNGFIERLYAQNEFAMKLGLDSMRRALQLESNPQDTHGRILVAGTNGKGGTASFLASILQAHGLRVGLYTSPHIMSLRERFRVQGRPLSQKRVHQFGREVLERYGDPEDGETPRLTFFELTTLMAAKAFRDEEVDVAVYEVGLGGRLDATNALEPELSVITSIALDHQKYLGDDIPSVAREKCGIIREDSPLVVGRQNSDEALHEIASCAPETTLYYGPDFSVDGRTISIRGSELEPALRGLAPETRWWNAACACAAASQWLGKSFERTATIHGLECTYWPGRMDLRRLPESPNARTYLFDAAHNPEGARSLFAFLDRSSFELGAVICGGMADKDLAGVFELIPASLPVFAATIDSPRASDASELRAALADKSVEAVGPTKALIERATLAVEADQVILVFGSIYLIGEAFSVLGVEPEDLRTFIRQPAPM